MQYATAGKTIPSMQSHPNNQTDAAKLEPLYHCNLNLGRHDRKLNTHA
jgi:hypothetical protein